MNILLLRIAPLTSYDKLHSLLTPSSCYLWLINGTEKETCSATGALYSAFSTTLELKPKNKKGIEKVKQYMHVCNLHWKELDAVRYQSRTVARALKSICLVLLDVPVDIAYVCHEL